MPAKFAFLIAATAFFAVLALDIAVPAVILSSMALSNWLVRSLDVPARPQGREAA
jgi:hypothetical protein